MTTQPTSLRITLYRTRTDQWRWRMRASNGLIVGASSEAYTKRQHAIANVELVTGFHWPKIFKSMYTLTVFKPMARGREA